MSYAYIIIVVYYGMEYVQISQFLLLFVTPSEGELCPILDITQNGRRFVSTKINPQFLLFAMGNIDMTLLFHITNILT